MSGSRSEPMWEFNFKFVKLVCLVLSTKPEYDPVKLSLIKLSFNISRQPKAKMDVTWVFSCLDSIKMFTLIQTLTVTCCGSPPSILFSLLLSWE